MSGKLRLGLNIDHVATVRNARGAGYPDPVRAALLAAEAGAVAHLNEDHADTLCLYAQKLCKAQAAAWRCVACDPEGLDMQCGNLAIRLTFPRRVTDPAALRKILKELADRARAAT